MLHMCQDVDHGVSMIHGAGDNLSAYTTLATRQPTAPRQDIFPDGGEIESTLLW